MEQREKITLVLRPVQYGRMVVKPPWSPKYDTAAYDDYLDFWRLSLASFVEAN